MWLLETSAVAKLVRTEPESAALRRWLRRRHRIGSDLHLTELRRAAARAGGRAPARADRLLAGMDLLRIDADVFDVAGRTNPPGLRSLDSLHVASAMTLGPDLAGSWPTTIGCSMRRGRPRSRWHPRTLTARHRSHAPTSKMGGMLASRWRREATQFGSCHDRPPDRRSLGGEPPRLDPTRHRLGAGALSRWSA
ncbi:MAG: PIN domain-containing protein [Ilumatobacteraceae bacterium]